MASELPNLNMHPQPAMSRNRRSPEQTADLLSEYAKACIRIAFWLLAAVISLAAVVGGRQGADEAVISGKGEESVVRQAVAAVQRVVAWAG